MKTKVMKIKKLLKVVPACLISLTIFAQEGQNMVDNGDFDNVGKLRRLGQIDAASGWISPTGESADVFSEGGKMPDVMVPENAYGKEDPKEGSGYAGIITYSYNDKENRTYITTRLNTPMKRGMRYKVKFYASLAELAKYSSNKIGAHFSKRELSTKDKVPALIVDTHVEHPKGEIFNGMYGWDLVCGEYTASGGEKYITIGNFTANNDVKNERNKKPREVKGTQIIAAYYYIDAISVQLLGPDESCDCPYGDKVKREASTLYQREPNITDKMSIEEQVAEYNVFYQSDRYDVTMAGDEALTEIAKLMIDNPNLKVQIIGHEDNNEHDDPEIENISLKRAEYVRNLMVNKSVDPSRFTLADVQNKQPAPFIKDTDDEKTKSAKNRRVSFKVVSQ